MRHIAALATTLIAFSSFTGGVDAQSTAKPWEERAIPAPAQTRKEGSLPKAELDALVKQGEILFSARFTPLDGVGRPGATQAIIPTRRKNPPQTVFSRLSGMDAGSCGACHNMPIVGGAGDFVTNVFVSEGFESADFDSSDPQFSNERGTNHLFGAGLVELLAREMTRDLQAQRASALSEAASAGQDVTVALTTKGVNFGSLTAKPDGIADLSKVDGVDGDLVVRPFSQKGVMTSLRQFTVNAMNHHHGIQPVERYGQRWTGDRDFDADGVKDELDGQAVSALVAWQATLEPPSEIEPQDEEWRAAAARGSKVFDQIDCQSCHKRSLPLESLSFSDPGPLDAAGTLREADVQEPARYDLSLMAWSRRLVRDDQGRVLVPMFGDLKRHLIADDQVAVFGNELLAQRFVERDVFMTSELWGMASTGPYGHRNDLPTIDEAILGHGGAARFSRDAYRKLDEKSRSDLIAYLKTLVIQ